MVSSLQFIFVLATIAIALSLRPLAKKFLLPYPLILVIIGFIVSEIIVGLGYDTGIRHYLYGPINLNIFIPAIIFSVSFSIDPKYLRYNSVAIFLLGLPVVVVSLFIIAALLYYGIGHPSGFPWIAAFITAALLSATYSRAILELLRQLKIPERLIVLIEGESLLSDIVTIVLFSLFIIIATNPQIHTGIWYWTVKLIWDVVGGLLIGIIIGLAAYGLLKIVKDQIAQALVSICAAYLSFLVAEHEVHVAGVVAVFCVGQLIRTYCRKNPDPFIGKLWDFNSLLATTGVFLLLGVTITLEMFSERWLAMIIGIVGVILARNIGVYGCLSFLSASKLVRPFNFAEQTVVNISGVRGAISIALAFAVPETLGYWWTIQSIAFGVVLFTLVIQAPLISWLITRTNMRHKLRA